jgi:phospholipid-binding lipoprotein MlaA
MTATSSRLKFSALALVILASSLSGCATPGRTTMEDPWQPMNRGIYAFNDTLDRYAVKPAAKGYKAVTPNWVRARIGQFFLNLGYPVTMVNQLLQGKPVLFAQDTGRFITNTTIGLGGLFDVADRMGMPAHEEDFGQTLAVWGVPSGPYFVLPFYGPSTARDAPARIPAWLMGIPRLTKTSPWVDYGGKALEVIDTRANLLSSDATLESAYDRYGVMRDAWLQRREYLIFDGNPPEEMLELEDEDLLDEDMSDEDTAATDDSDAPSTTPNNETADPPADAP